MSFSLQQLTYRYASSPAFELKPISMGINSNQITAIIGSNGSGKTTLIKLLTGELLTYSGELTFYPPNTQYGFTPDARAEFLHNCKIGYLPEHPVLEQRLRPVEILHSLSLFHNDPQLPERAERLFADLHIEPEWFTTRRCSDLSQGMARKTGLLMAFVIASHIHVLDEPTNGLDPLSVSGLKRLLLARKEAGIGTIFSSHILDFVERLADQLIVLHKGQLLYSGSTSALLHRYDNQKNLDEIYSELCQQI